MKTKKKLLFLFAACAATATAAIALGACGKTEHVHDWGDWEVATPATCTQEGLETRVCKGDASHKENRVLNAKGHGTPVKTNESPATCTENGTAAYWSCSDCGQKFADEDGETPITAPAVLPAAHGELVKTNESPATCTENGTAAYWSCSDCGQKFADEDGETPITAPSVLLAGHGEIYHSVAKAATCGSVGTPEYWMCLVCYQKFADADGTQEIADEDFRTTPVDPTAHMTLEHRAQVDATCTSEGTAEYWYCPGCLNNYNDAAGANKITKPATIPVTHGALTKTEAVAATCASEGVNAYWTCGDCGQMFSDENGVNKIAKAVTTAKSSHTPSAVAAGTGASVTLPNGTVMTQQNNAHYRCDVCGKLFADSDCKNEITNPAKYISRGGGVLSSGSNLMCIPQTTLPMFFKAEETGYYAVNMDKCSILRMFYFAEAADGNTGVQVYGAESWYQSSKYINLFSKNNISVAIDGMFYVKMEAGEVINITFNGITANTVFCVDVEKLDIDDTANNLFVGTNGVVVADSEVDEGVLYKFIAPAEGFYELSVPANSKAYIMKVVNDIKSGIVSPGEDKTSFVFKAAKNEAVEFYMSVDTMSGDVEFPVTYTVTVSDDVQFPEVVIGAASKDVQLAGGYSEYEFMVDASQDGTYVLQMKPYPGTMRNYYKVYVNGAMVGSIQASAGDNGVWKMEILLGEGVNIIKLENAMPQNSAGPMGISVVPKAD